MDDEENESNFDFQLNFGAGDFDGMKMNRKKWTLRLLIAKVRCDKTDFWVFSQMNLTRSKRFINGHYFSFDVFRFYEMEDIPALKMKSIRIQS